MKCLRTMWELPQNTLGLLIKKIFKAEYYVAINGVKVYTWKLKDAMSLGDFIFVSENTDVDKPEGIALIRHEYGHTLQSKYLGWLYLLVIGLPSIVWAGCFSAYRKKHNISYYSFYTEKWADRLGNVIRGI